MFNHAWKGLLATNAVVGYWSFGHKWYDVWFVIWHSSNICIIFE